jgi:predicted esterase
VRALLLAALLAAAAPAAGDDPFPPGTSSQSLEGLRCSIVMPESGAAAQGRSLLVILHGAGGTETGMAGSLAHLAADGFVVLAPKSAGQTWAKADLDAVRKVAADLKKRLGIADGRMHAAGFSNGGWNLADVAFDEHLKFSSACWIAAGFKGGKPPPHARKGMGALALAGAEDGNRDAAEKTPDLLDGKVRSAECRIQPNLGHAWPEKLMPYYRWWLLVQEGRFVPGDCAAFEWIADPAAAADEAKARKTGRFVYLWSAAQAADPAAKAFQNDTLRDAVVQRFGSQLVAARIEAPPGSPLLAEHGVKETPAVVVYDAEGKALKALAGPKITAAALGAALRLAAPDRTLPKR